MDRVENEFLDSELVKLWLWLRYIDDVFFIWTESEKKLEGFLNRLNDFHPDLKFTHEKSKSSVNFWMSVLALPITKLRQICIANLLIVISFSTLTLRILSTTKNLLFIAKDCASKDFVRHLWLSKNTWKV